MLFQMKSAIFWDVMPCSTIGIYQCAGGMYSLHLQGQKLIQARNRQKAELFRLQFASDGYVNKNWH
jgi:hypothetical protein